MRCAWCLGNSLHTSLCTETGDAQPAVHSSISRAHLLRPQAATLLSPELTACMMQAIHFNSRFHINFLFQFRLYIHFWFHFHFWFIFYFWFHVPLMALDSFPLQSTFTTGSTGLLIKDPSIPQQGHLAHESYLCMGCKLRTY